MVESGACNVEIACDNVRDEDAIAFAADLSKEKCSHLQQLHLKCETIGELGRQALERMMGHCGASLVIIAFQTAVGAMSCRRWSERWLRRLA